MANRRSERKRGYNEQDQQVVLFFILKINYICNTFEYNVDTMQEGKGRGWCPKKGENI